MPARMAKWKSWNGNPGYNRSPKIPKWKFWIMVLPAVFRLPVEQRWNQILALGGENVQTLLIPHADPGVFRSRRKWSGDNRCDRLEQSSRSGFRTGGNPVRRRSGPRRWE